jgi:hypothetical protein
MLGSGSAAEDSRPYITKDNLIVTNYVFVILDRACSALF